MVLNSQKSKQLIQNHSEGLSMEHVYMTLLYIQKFQKSYYTEVNELG
jgi:hypothetical protein